MVANSLLEQGAELLISRNLGMRKGQDVVIIIDEVTYEVGLVLDKAARKLGVRPTLIHVSREQQSSHKQGEQLPTPLSRAISSAQGLANALSDFTEGTGFRVAILQESQGFQCKIAHMPGLTTEMIESLVETDYNVLEKGCETLRAPLLLGRKVTIITEDLQGNFHELRLDLGGWDYPPVVSSGIVHHSSFDNVPSGEVYIPPLKGTADGSVVINGSVTGYVFGNADEILVHFAEGALKSLTPSDHPAAQILQRQIDRASESGDAEPHFLCELGIGVNTAVKQLTGGTLMDEKAFGTAHIAIGTNDEFGGDVLASHIHEDLVFRKPTILVDNKLIVERGDLAVVESDWRPSYSALKSADPYDGQNVMVEWTGMGAEINNQGLLERIYIDGTVVTCKITVGDDETAKLAASVFQTLSQEDAISIEKLVEMVNIPQEQLQKLLHIMGGTYGLVQIPA